MGTPTGRQPLKTRSAAAAALTASGQGAGQDLRGAAEVVAILNVLAMAGTASPTFAAKLQVSQDNATNWTDVPGGGFTTVSAAPNRQTLKVIGDVADGYLRLAYTITGTTPSFTVAVDLIGLALRDSVLADSL